MTRHANAVHRSASLRKTVSLGWVAAAAFAASVSATACDADDPTPSPNTLVGQAYDDAPGGGDLGASIFRTRCASCHGADAEGRVGMGPKLASKSFLEAASDEMLLTTIRKGRKGTTMVAWESALRDKEVKAIVSWLRSLVPHERVELDESPVKGDPAAGKEVFVTICSRCHGRAGAGYQEASSGTGIGRKAFLSSVSDGYLRHIIKNGKSQTQMRAFDKSDPAAIANLSAPDIENVIAYLRQEAW